jgi:Zn-dependent protease
MDPVTIAGVTAVVIVSITSHEAAHGFAADRLGDPTARNLGRLTLNPLPHIDLFFTILLPLFLILSGTGFVFGGAKPVPVDVTRLRNPRRDWAVVGLAGPAMNLLLALILAAALSLAFHLGEVDSTSSLTEILAVGVFVNVLLGLFNLIPIPPLDGSRVVQLFLSGEALLTWLRLERWGLLLVVALVFLVPQVWLALADAVFDLSALVAGAFGVWELVEPVVRSVLFG